MWAFYVLVSLSGSADLPPNYPELASYGFDSRRVESSIWGDFEASETPRRTAVGSPRSAVEFGGRTAEMASEALRGLVARLVVDVAHGRREVAMAHPVLDGSRTRLAVLGRRRGWLAVSSEALGNA